MADMCSIYFHGHVHVLHTVSDMFRKSWHLLNIRIQGLREYALNHVVKGSRLLVSGRIEYSQSTKEDGSTKDLTTVVLGEYVVSIAY